MDVEDVDRDSLAGRERPVDRRVVRALKLAAERVVEVVSVEAGGPKRTESMNPSFQVIGKSGPTAIDRLVGRVLGEEALWGRLARRRVRHDVAAGRRMLP